MSCAKYVERSASIATVYRAASPVLDWDPLPASGRPAQEKGVKERAWRGPSD